MEPVSTQQRKEEAMWSTAFFSFYLLWYKATTLERSKKKSFVENVPLSVTMGATIECVCQLIKKKFVLMKQQCNYEQVESSVHWRPPRQ